MKNISWRIELGAYDLQVVEEVTITKSVSSLTDTAVIKLPVSVLNKALTLNDKLKRGDKVSIYVGYDTDLVKEFEGYLEHIQINQDGISVECEDAMFLFRKAVQNKTHKAISVKGIVQLLIRELGLSLSVNCTYEMNYEKFIINDAQGFDVLTKIQEDTKANIYIRDNSIYIEPSYLTKAGEVVYDFARNIENGNLTWKRAEDRKVQIKVSCTSPAGKVLKATKGVTGGEKITRNMGSNFNQAALQKIAEEELKRYQYAGYEGTITGWLVPVVEPSYSAIIYDDDYPERAGTYYVEAVETKMSESGGVRTITIGRKLN